MNGNSQSMNGGDNQQIEIEYINEDENILAPGRHVAEFKHIFEHFSTPVIDKSLQSKKEDDKQKGSKDEESKNKNNKKDEEQD